MATSYTSNKKIGALDSASTPLAAANEIVLNQNGDIVKAALSDVEAKVFDAKTAKTTVDGTEVVVVRQTDNSLRQVPLDNIVKADLITNAMVKSDAAIADSKLATINTAGKVTNNAVQATSANTASRIVTRDGSGNFAAGTITASLSGNATTATTATTLATGRTIALTGDVTGTTGSFNGSANVSADTTIANSAVTEAKIASNAVTTAKIADGDVTNAKIASGVDAAKLTTGTLPIARIANDAVDDTKLRNSAALSVIGRSANSTGDPADIAAGSDGEVLRRSGTALGFGQIVAAGIATDAVETAKIKDANVTAAKLAGTLDLTGKTVTLPAASVSPAALATSAVETAKINDGAVTAAKLSGAQSGAAPIYGCRAWVNFDGTRDSGGAASTANTNRFIRAAGNVASVLRNGTGDYTVTLTTALTDANYAVTFGGRRSQDVGDNEPSPQLSFSNATTTTFKVGSQDNDSNTYREATDVCVAVFR